MNCLTVADIPTFNSLVAEVVVLLLFFNSLVEVLLLARARSLAQFIGVEVFTLVDNAKETLSDLLIGTASEERLRRVFVFFV